MSQPRVCKDCRHYCRVPWIPKHTPYMGAVDLPRCMRKQRLVIDPVSGLERWPSEGLSPYTERCLGWWWSDRCGPEGKYFAEKEPQKEIRVVRVEVEV